MNKMLIFLVLRLLSLSGLDQTQGMSVLYPVDSEFVSTDERELNGINCFLTDMADLLIVKNPNEVTTRAIT